MGTSLNLHLRPHSHLPPFQTSSFLARALFQPPSRSSAGSSSPHSCWSHLFRMSNVECRRDHFTSCFKPSASLLSAFRLKDTRHFQAFQALHDSVPASPSRLTPYLSAVNALCSGHSGWSSILSCLCIGSHAVWRVLPPPPRCSKSKTPVVPQYSAHAPYPAV